MYLHIRTTNTILCLDLANICNRIITRRVTELSPNEYNMLLVNLKVYRRANQFSRPYERKDQRWDNRKKSFEVISDPECSPFSGKTNGI